MWGLAALFYLFDMFQRVSPASLAFDLSREIAPTAVALGALSSAYFLTYAGFQLPAGILVDRFGARRVLSSAALGGALGAAVFALSPQLSQALLGRLILGASGAAAWIALLKLGSEWFPPRAFAGISGLSLAVGGLGAVLAGLPLSAVAQAVGWRAALLISSLAAVVLALLLWWLIRDRPPEAPPTRATDAAPAPDGQQPDREQFGALPWGPLLILGLGQMAVTGSVAAIAWLWSVPFLKMEFGLSASLATLLASLMMLSFAVGGIAFGRWSDRIQERRRPMVLGTSGVVLMLLVLGSELLAASLAATVACLCLMALCAGSMVLSFAAAKDLARGRHTGAVVALMNLCVMTGSIGLPTLFGMVLDAQWQGLVVEGVRVYPGSAFALAFLGLAGWNLVALLIQLGSRDVLALEKAR